MMENDKKNLWKKLQLKTEVGLCLAKTKSVNAKEFALIRKLQFDIIQRKKQFGLQYMSLKTKNADPEKLQACVEECETDIKVIQDQIDTKEDFIGVNNEKLRQVISGDEAAASTPTTATE